MSEERHRPGSTGGLAHKLNRLLELHRRPDGTTPSLRVVARGVTEAGAPLSASYLSQLLSGQRDNPSGAVVQGLARYFHVDVGYFLGEPDDVDRVEANLALRQAMHDREVRDIAVRAARLTPASLRALAAFIDHLETASPRARRRPGREVEGSVEG